MTLAPPRAVPLLVLLTAAGACTPFRSQPATDAAATDADSAGDVPADTPAGPRVVQIALGAAHTCARISDGTVRCWGGNSRGEIGAGLTEGPLPTPQTVMGIAGGATDLVAGGFNTCALLAGDRPRCWGENISYELGTGDGPMGAARAPVPTLNTNATQIALGGSLQFTPSTDAGTVRGATNCAVFSGTAPQLQCWGANIQGSAGSGTINVPVMSPATVNGLTGPSAVAVGQTHACAVTANGVQCWGANDFGQLGRGSMTDPQTTPGLVQGLGAGTVRAIALGGERSCALVDQMGTTATYCWGSNGLGELGFGHTTNVSLPQRLTSYQDGLAATQIALGSYHTCARMTDGTVQCWGINTSGEVGNGSTDDVATPRRVEGLTDIEAVAVGGSHSCALQRGGRLFCWGSNYSGQLGNGRAGANMQSLSPIEVQVLP